MIALTSDARFIVLRDLKERPLPRWLFSWGLAVIQGLERHDLITGSNGLLALTEKGLTAATTALEDPTNFSFYDYGYPEFLCPVGPRPNVTGPEYRQRPAPISPISIKPKSDKPREVIIPSTKSSYSTEASIESSSSPSSSPITNTPKKRGRPPKKLSISDIHDIERSIY